MSHLVGTLLVIAIICDILIAIINRIDKGGK